MVAAILGALAAAVLTGPFSVHGATRPAAGRPNVVLVVTDDQRAESLAGMPLVNRLLVDQGTLFSNAMVPTSRCCPSRAAILTGLYSHHTQVYDNSTDVDARYGGWATFHRRGLEFRSIAMALQRAGYRTGLFGKYFNGFDGATPENHRPPGWDEMAAFRDGPGAYFRYRLSDGGWHGTDPEDYSTDVLAERARDFIRSTPADQPLFLMYTPFAPHSPYVPAPRHAAIDAADLAVPEAGGPTVDRSTEDAVPGWLTRRSGFEERFAPSVPQAQTRSLLAVDEAVSSLVDTLERTGRERDTLFVFLSDNGYLWGEHGLVGKDAAYDGALRIPLVVRWDGRVDAGQVDDRLALNLDVATTIAAAAGVQMRTDGLDLLDDRTRPGFVVEAVVGRGGRPPFCGWRTKRYLYTRYADGRTEMYDYRTDPFEQDNIVGEPPARKVEQRMLARAREHCDPTPPGFDW